MFLPPQFVVRVEENGPSRIVPIFLNGGRSKLQLIVIHSFGTPPSTPVQAFEVAEFFSRFAAQDPNRDERALKIRTRCLSRGLVRAVPPRPRVNKATTPALVERRHAKRWWMLVVEDRLRQKRAKRAGFYRNRARRDCAIAGACTRIMAARCRGNRDRSRRFPSSVARRQMLVFGTWFFWGADHRRRHPYCHGVGNRQISRGKNRANLRPLEKIVPTNTNCTHITCWILPCLYIWRCRASPDVRLHRRLICAAMGAKTPPHGGPLKPERRINSDASKTSHRALEAFDTSRIGRHIHAARVVSDERSLQNIALP